MVIRSNLAINPVLILYVVIASYFNKMDEIIDEGELYYLRAKEDNTSVYESASSGDAIILVNGVKICTIRAVSCSEVAYVDVML